MAMISELTVRVYNPGLEVTVSSRRFETIKSDGLVDVSRMRCSFGFTGLFRQGEQLSFCNENLILRN